MSTAQPNPVPRSSITPFRLAADTVIPFGKYAGKTIDQIGTPDEGLLYLDWLRGQRPPDLKIRAAIEKYLDDPTISECLRKIRR